MLDFGSCISELIKLDEKRFDRVLTEYIRCAVKGRPNQILLAAERTRVLNTPEYVKKKAFGLASGKLV